MIASAAPPRTSDCKTRWSPNRVAARPLSSRTLDKSVSASVGGACPSGAGCVIVSANHPVLLIRPVVQHPVEELSLQVAAAGLMATNDNSHSPVPGQRGIGRLPALHLRTKMLQLRCRGECEILLDSGPYSRAHRVEHGLLDRALLVNALREAPDLREHAELERPQRVRHVPPPGNLALRRGQQ
jgi:hypothetical protein